MAENPVEKPLTKLCSNGYQTKCLDILPEDAYDANATSFRYHTPHFLSVDTRTTVLLHSIVHFKCDTFVWCCIYSVCFFLIWLLPFVGKCWLGCACHPCESKNSSSNMYPCWVVMCRVWLIQFQCSSPYEDILLFLAETTISPDTEIGVWAGMPSTSLITFFFNY